MTPLLGRHHGFPILGLTRRIPPARTRLFRPRSSMVAFQLWLIATTSLHCCSWLLCSCDSDSFQPRHASLGHTNNSALPRPYALADRKFISTTLVSMIGATFSRS
ncbi:hypothetical protein BDV93DRAFT_317107 [Ceratobasidium sp. AG-I]|nr:hypothetical protein BDV93DRAFT_317107 [Ceratobasidium sp. AG-I]